MEFLSNVKCSMRALFVIKAKERKTLDIKADSSQLCRWFEIIPNRHPFTAEDSIAAMLQAEQPDYEKLSSTMSRHGSISHEENGISQRTAKNVHRNISNLINAILNQTNSSTHQPRSWSSGNTIQGPTEKRPSEASAVFSNPMFYNTSRIKHLCIQATFRTS